MAYRVKKAFQIYQELTTLVDGVRVALNDAYVHTAAGTAQHPPKTISIPLATQSQLKKIFERGDPCIEQYEEEKPVEIENNALGLIEQSQGKKKIPQKNEP